ncbi:uncharacterized protein A4U43_C04F35670 [Asparagus officinalis]|uniref:NAD(P)H-quinone oxidoreductase subunit M, chloroplastic n=1 Tax=Asparagus officinalis TaxID=4686 RepID=A0A5P1F605_ASPOF|nr:uncharacterized protein A4U43_C04F35670 [Asparagus officinalis]
MTREYGSQWLSSVTRHVRIYAAYIDPVTHAFDQTQTDKLTLILDPSNEFVWTPESCQKVYAYFQELVDHYEGAPLSEYTLRLIGSDIEHYIRKLLYDGEINYNMNARMLNFSMGKPRVKFNSNQIPNSECCVDTDQVGVEGYDAGSPVELERLDGTWRLNYTSASDVLVLFEAAARLPFLQVGQIFQKFECRDRVDGGIVRNVVRWSIQNLLEEQEGATLLVSAKFSLLSNRNIYLQFEEVAVENIKISEQLQALIAPAILPRSFLSLQILQFIRTFRAQVPVRSPERRSPGGLYYLSYLDRDMLLGRSVGGGGAFVFTRAQALTS